MNDFQAENNALLHYPFGMLMPGRNFGSETYRYGFNGKENDDEVKGEGSQQDYGFRIYDTRIGKFLSVDPLTRDYPWYTPYQFAGNMPIWAIDIDGLEEQTESNVVQIEDPIECAVSNFTSEEHVNQVRLLNGPVTPAENNENESDHSINMDVSDKVETTLEATQLFTNAVGTYFGSLEFITKNKLPPYVSNVFKQAAKSMIIINVTAGAFEFIFDPTANNALELGTDALIGWVASAGPLGLTVAAVYVVVDETVGWDSVADEVIESAKHVKEILWDGIWEGINDMRESIKGGVYPQNY